MSINLNQIKQDLTQITNDVLTAANLRRGDIFVLGCSTSEVVGGHIGKPLAAKSVQRLSKPF